MVATHLLLATPSRLQEVFFSSRRRHTRSLRDWSSDVCSSDLLAAWPLAPLIAVGVWWNSNTIAHNFIHRPFFRSAGMNRVFSADRKSTRLNSSHVEISYAVFCLKKKKKNINNKKYPIK